MDWEFWVKLIVALAFVCGGAILAYRLSQRDMSARPEPGEVGSPYTESKFSHGLTEQTLTVLAAIPEVAIVYAEAEDQVILPPVTALQWGLVKGDKLRHESARALVEKVREEGGAHEAEVHIPPGQIPGSGDIYLHLRASRLTLGHVLILVSDRTEARRVEAIRREFVANVSHELKTPVGAISLLAETIADNPDNPEMVAEFSKTLAGEAQRLTNLVGDIISLNRLEDSLQARPEDLQVAAIVGKVLDDLAASLRERNLAVEVHLEDVPLVQGVEDQIYAAVRNLVDNAMRYTEGTAPLDLRLVTRAAAISEIHPPAPGSEVKSWQTKERRWVVVEVRDHGPGVPEHLRERIFERFFRADKARSRQTGGTGLGLSIVKHVALNHRGQVAVGPAWPDGSGALFSLYLPALKSAAGGSN